MADAQRPAGASAGPRFAGLGRGFDQAAQHFGDAPGLSDATPRREWRLRIEDLVDRADTSLVQMRNEAFQKFTRPFPISRVDFQPGIDNFGLVSFQLLGGGHALTINIEITDVLEQLRLHGGGINWISALHF